MTDPALIRTKPQQIADYYQGLINAGAIMPGHRLPPATEIAETFGVAKRTAQTALQILRQRNLVTIVHRQGTYAAIAA